MQCSSLCDNLELTNDIVKEVEAIVVVDDEVETKERRGSEEVV